MKERVTGARGRTTAILGFGKEGDIDRQTDRQTDRQSYLLGP